MAVGLPRAWAPTVPGTSLLTEIQLDAPRGGGRGGFEGAVSKYLPLLAKARGPHPCLPLLPVASTSASAGPPSTLTVAHSFTISLHCLEKGGDFQATRMGVLALG